MLMTKGPKAAERPTADLVDALRRCVAPVEQAASLPPACYRDAAVLKAELETIFRRRWVGIGRADRFKAPGDYETLEIGGVPLIVLRDKAGGLRAFANTCRHRGARLLARISHTGHGQRRPQGRAQPGVGRVEGLDRCYGTAFRPSPSRARRLNATQAMASVRNAG